MKVISFDVGIKNMAYCIFECSDTCKILKWDVLNLMEENVVEQPICSCINVLKTKKNIQKPCTKKAKYGKNDKYYCDKHAKETNQYIIRPKKYQGSQLNKNKLVDLNTIAMQHFIIDDTTTEKRLKKDVLKMITEYFDKVCFDEITIGKQKKASEIDLIDIGRNMKRRLDEIPEVNELDWVVIENQISPIANRMKTIQGMLAQYFIMNNPDTDISFISSSNKLKQFSFHKIEKREPNQTEEITNKNYKENKKNGVYYSLKLLEQNDNLNEWIETLNTKKKDDLADSFLQGIWALRQKNIIICAEDLKIKLV
jgi:hypothetical protein